MSKYIGETGLLYLWGKIKAIFATKTEVSAKANSADLASVATSGSYNDLSNKPTIPSDSGLVHTSGDETIAGDKTFTGVITGTDINGDLYGGVYATYAEIGWGAIVPPVDGNVGTLTLISDYSAGDAQLTVGNTLGNPDGETSEEQATGGWSQIYNAVTDTTLQDELDNIPKLVVCTLAEYNAMASHNSSTYYVIVEQSNS